VLSWVNGSETTALAIERGWAGFLVSWTVLVLLPCIFL
jgi:hypothetical protein